MSESLHLMILFTFGSDDVILGKQTTEQPVEC